MYSLVDKEACIITGDGSNICGVLKGCDRATNVIFLMHMKENIQKNEGVKKEDRFIYNTW